MAPPRAWSAFSTHQVKSPLATIPARSMIRYLGETHISRRVVWLVILILARTRIPAVVHIRSVLQILITRVLSPWVTAGVTGVVVQGLAVLSVMCVQALPA